MSRLAPDPAGCLKPVLEREHAQAAARRMRQHDKTVRAYRCRDCGGWHVGGTAPIPAYWRRPTHQGAPLCNR